MKHPDLFNFMSMHIFENYIFLTQKLPEQHIEEFHQS